MKVGEKASRREAAEALAAAFPFSVLAESEISALAATAQIRDYEAGAQIFLEGERSAAAWVLAGGRVRILTFVAHSRMFQIERLGPRQIFGICCRIAGAVDRYQCSAIAETNARAVRVPDSAFFSAFQRSPAFSRASCELCARRLGSLRRSIRDARLGVRARLARRLFELRAAGSDNIAATRHAMAAWVGAAPETVFRALAHWRRRGVLTTGRGTIRVRDWNALSAEARGEELD